MFHLSDYRKNPAPEVFHIHHVLTVQSFSCFRFGSITNEIVEEYQVPYQIHYGNNYFPAKYYKGITYPAGNYESLVITLGSGAGKNFWCVLFPPLCLLENTEEDISDVDYRLYVKKLLDGSK